MLKNIFSENRKKSTRNREKSRYGIRHFYKGGWNWRIAQQWRTLFQTWAWLSAPTWHLTTVCNSYSVWSSAFFWLLQVPGMYMVHTPTWRHNIHLYKIMLFLKKMKEGGRQNHISVTFITGYHYTFLLAFYLYCVYKFIFNLGLWIGKHSVQKIRCYLKI